MDKKKLPKGLSGEDLKGFEDFIEGQSGDPSFMSRQQQTRKDISFEHFTFLTNDAERMMRIKNLLSEKIPFFLRHQQGTELLKDEENELKLLRRKLFELSEKPESNYRKSLGEIFNNFYTPES